MINPADLLQWKSLIKNALAKYFAPMPPSDGEVYGFQDGTPVIVGGSGGGGWATETRIEWGDGVSSYEIDIAPGASQIEICFREVYSASGSQKLAFALGQDGTFYPTNSVSSESIFGVSTASGAIGTATGELQVPKHGTFYIPTTGTNLSGLIRLDGNLSSGVGPYFQYAVNGAYGLVGAGAAYVSALLVGRIGTPVGATPNKLRISKTGNTDLYGFFIVRSR